MKSEPLADRFWRKVDKNGPVPEHCKHLGPCWIWTGAIGYSGYGSILRGLKTEGTRRSCPAHRVAFELEHGSCPSDRQVNHECDTRACVNPAHLHLGDHASNSREMFQRGRARIGASHPRAKLDEAKVIAARRANASGVSNAKLAILYGVTPGVMWRAVSGKTWRNV